MRRTFLTLIGVLLAGLALAERVEVERPWLSAYDDAGNLVWELRAAAIRGTATGWRAEEVVAYLYSDGAPLVTVHIPTVTADPAGPKWRADGGVTGEGEGFSFTAEEVEWTRGELRLGELRLISGELELRALRAFWEPGGVWKLLGVEASFGEWKLEFAEGVYDQTDRILRIPQGLTARGWGWEIAADEATVDVDAERVTLRGVKVGPA